MVKIKNIPKWKLIVGGVVILAVLLGAIIFVFLQVVRPVSTHSGGPMESKYQYADLIQDDVMYPVVHVVDGDTVIVRASAASNSADSAINHDVTIRLIGIDTPETVDPRKPVQCFGPEASAEGKHLLASTSVYVEKDPLKGDYDKYGRVLAYIRMADGTSYNEYMLTHGFAHEYTYFNQPYKYQTEFKSDEQNAKKAGVGLWAKCVGK